MKRTGCLIALVVAVVILGMSLMGVYNGLVGSQQAVEAQWGQVQNAYQRRADLIPNLVKTVQGSAAFEQTTLKEVVEARSRVGQATPQAPAEVLNDPQKFQQYQQAQDALGSALGRLLVVVERYPELKSTSAFQGLMVALEGSENRINVERHNFNTAAQDYNTRVRRFPAVLFASMMGFQPKPYFQAQAGAETAPKVDFGPTGTGAPAPAPNPGR